MPRSKEIILGEKTFTIYECKIKTLEKFAGEAALVVDVLFKDGSKAVEAKDAVLELLYEQIPKLFSGITKEDIMEAYPSEIEELVQAFVDLHFFALKRLAGPLLTVIQAGLQAKF